jgi:hypothetical protein
LDKVAWQALGCCVNNEALTVETIQPVLSAHPNEAQPILQQGADRQITQSFGFTILTK